MTSFLLMTIWIMPLIIALFAFWRRVRWIAPLAVIPAISCSILLTGEHLIEIDWLLLGTHLGLDETGRWFLVSSALVWAASAIYAFKWPQNSAHAAIFYLFFLLAMSGNFLLILAMDMVTFYLGFALMGLSAFGLIVANSNVQTLKTAYFYLGWTIVGEVILFSAIILLAGQSDSIQFSQLKTVSLDEFALILVVIGFGIKIALPGLHMWLPLTYSVLPSAAAAVFSGPMISAGLLGLIRFLANPNYGYDSVGQLLLVAGFIGALSAAVVGLLQSCPKVALGYSSMAKMGLLAATLGLSLVHPSDSSVLVLAITVYAVHHLLVKSALFLGIELLEQNVARAIIISATLILCLTLASLPLTTGSLAKAELINAIPVEASWFKVWLSVVSITSMLLIGRILYLLLSIPPKAGSANISGLIVWLGICLLVIVFPLVSGYQHEEFSNIIPVIVTIAVILFVWQQKPKTLKRWVGLVPPGDILHPLVFSLNRIKQFMLLPAASILKQTEEVMLRKWQTLVQWSGKISFQTFTQPRIDSVWIIITSLLFVLVMTGNYLNI